MIEFGLFFIAFFGVVPVIAAVIGYAAWMGKPKNFGRDMYWTAFIAASAAASFLFVCSQRMKADVRTGEYLVQVGLFSLAVIFSGVATGCMIGIFAYRRGSSSQAE